MGNRNIFLPGDKFGYWVVIDFSHKDSRNNTFYNCLCTKCNETIKPVKSVFLKNGETKSCRSCSKIKHGHGKRKNKKSTPTYNTYNGMIARCYNTKNDAYPDYGGRGITVSAKWRLKFEYFLVDMGERPSLIYTIEIINVNDGYYKENCIWIPKSYQSRNRRNTPKYELNGEIKSLSDWADLYNKPYRLVWDRINISNWDLYKALVTPIFKPNKKLVTIKDNQYN